jgi:hypothetical protein
MIRFGRYSRLLRFVMDALGQNNLAAKGREAK